MIKSAKELAEACVDVAKNYKTLYVMGCFGWPMTESMKQRAMEEYAYNRTDERKAMIQAAGADTFGFDCVNMIKALLWGWMGDKDHIYGGAAYQSNGVPDIDEAEMISRCSDVSTDFSAIEVGEVAWKTGHMGLYIGDGLLVECSPKWDNCVQITAVRNIGTKTGYNSRTWTKHGKLPYVTYSNSNDYAEIKEKVIEVELTVLKKGAAGSNVKALQALLTGYGYEMQNNGKTYTADGSFGTATENAVKAYQKDNGLEADGSVGRKTWQSLLGL